MAKSHVHVLQKSRYGARLMSDERLKGSGVTAIQVSHNSSRRSVPNDSVMDSQILPKIDLTADHHRASTQADSYYQSCVIIIQNQIKEM